MGRFVRAASTLTKAFVRAADVLDPGSPRYCPRPLALINHFSRSVGRLAYKISRDPRQRMNRTPMTQMLLARPDPDAPSCTSGQGSGRPAAPLRAEING